MNRQSKTKKRASIAAVGGTSALSYTSSPIRPNRHSSPEEDELDRLKQETSQSSLPISAVLPWKGSDEERATLKVTVTDESPQEEDEDEEIEEDSLEPRQQLLQSMHVRPESITPTPNRPKPLKLDNRSESDLELPIMQSPKEALAPGRRSQAASGRNSRASYKPSASPQPPRPESPAEFSSVSDVDPTTSPTDSAAPTISPPQSPPGRWSKPLHGEGSSKPADMLAMARKPAQSSAQAEPSDDLASRRVYVSNGESRGPDGTLRPLKLDLSVNSHFKGYAVNRQGVYIPIGGCPSSIEIRTLYQITPTGRFTSTRRRSQYNEITERPCALHRINNVHQLLIRGTPGGVEPLYIYEEVSGGFVDSGETAQFSPEAPSVLPATLRWSIQEEPGDGSAGAGLDVPDTPGDGTLTPGKKNVTFSSSGGESYEQLAAGIRSARAVVVSSGQPATEVVVEARPRDESRQSHHSHHSHHRVSTGQQQLQVPQQEHRASGRGARKIRSDSQIVKEPVASAGVRQPLYRSISNDSGEREKKDRDAAAAAAGRPVVTMTRQTSTSNRPAFMRAGRSNSSSRLKRHDSTSTRGLPGTHYIDDSDSDTPAPSAQEKDVAIHTYAPDQTTNPNQAAPYMSVGASTGRRRSLDTCVLTLCIKGGSSQRPKIGQVAISRHVDFDDKEMFLRLNDEYHRMRGFWRRLLSLKGIKYIGLVRYNRAHDLEIGNDAASVAASVLGPDKVSPHKLIDYFHNPNSVANKYDWVDWSFKLRNQENRYALDFVEGWRVGRITIAILIVMMAAVIVGIIGTVLGIGSVGNSGLVVTIGKIGANGGIRGGNGIDVLTAFTVAGFVFWIGLGIVGLVALLSHFVS